MKRRLQWLVIAVTVAAGLASYLFRTSAAPFAATLSAPFERQILQPPPEAPFNLRFFTTAVKTDSRGRVITGPTSDPVKDIVGPEPAGERGGLPRFTKVMFGASYIDGRPDPGPRLDPHH